MNKLLSVMLSLFVTVTMYLPSGGTKVWERVRSFDFEDERNIILVKGYAMIPVLKFVTKEGDTVYLHGHYTVEETRELAAQDDVVENDKTEERKEVEE